MAEKTYKLVVLTNAVEGAEEAFNAWYDNQHLSDVLKIPAFVKGQRFRAEAAISDGAIYKYCAIYDCVTSDPQAALAALGARSAAGEMPSSDALDRPFHAVLYEPLGPERLP